jgi:D-alanyl-D-alanine carboxypeptidase
VLISAIETNEICSYNMSAQVAEGNGYTTMKNLNTYIRTLMKGENVLSMASIEMMKHDVSTASPTYGLGCFYSENLGYGHNGARVGNMSLMMYDPELDISLVTYISAIDEVDFMETYNAITDVAYAVREAMGYPGKPQ